ncbi:hypothetical protein [Dethiothermospora halolimnae]|uniref:hypothetical protein n=1 Tax=Dethiothermospora halolimnae TaxID=3114390 RepID=UPI003CCB89AD
MNNKNIATRNDGISENTIIIEYMDLSILLFLFHAEKAPIIVPIRLLNNMDIITIPRVHMALFNMIDFTGAL